MQTGNSKLKPVIRLLEQYYKGKDNPEKNPNPGILDLLIATKLSQNTTDKTSYKAFVNLKTNFKSWEEVMNAPLSKIKENIRVCGLTNVKAKQIKQMLKEMKQNYGSLDLSFLKKLSNDEIYKELLHYEGLGVKTISCVIAFSLHRDAFPVDTHVHRVLNRLGIVNTNNPVKTYEGVNGKIPKGKKASFHTHLIKFGRNICKANNPLCMICFLYDYCEYEYKEEQRAKKTPLNLKENNFIILENI